MVARVATEHVDGGVRNAEGRGEEGSLDLHGRFVFKFDVSVEVGVAFAEIVIDVRTA